MSILSLPLLPPSLPPFLPSSLPPCLPPSIPPSLPSFPSSSWPGKSTPYTAWQHNSYTNKTIMTLASELWCLCSSMQGRGRELNLTCPMKRCVVSIHSPGLVPPLLLVQVVLLVIMDMNIARLTAADIPLFNGFAADLFQGVEVHVYTVRLTMER